jgi:hypothetical protein
MPLARQRLLAPAIFLPLVVLRLLNSFFISKFINKKASRLTGKLLNIVYYILFPVHLFFTRMRIRPRRIICINESLMFVSNSWAKIQIFLIYQRKSDKFIKEINLIKVDPYI